jgi:hypothetical protein
MAYVNLARRSGLGAARGRSHVVGGDLFPRRPWRRGIAGFGVRSRGLGVSFPQVMISVPQPGGNVTQEPSAETSLANAAAQYINDPTQFTAAQNTPEFASPAAFSANMIAYAKTLCQYSWSPYTCVGFDPVTMGQKYANIVFDALRGIILPSTGQSLYDTWVNKPPVLPPSYTPPVIQAPYNPASVPGSSALPPPPALPPVASNPQPVAAPPVSTPGQVMGSTTYSSNPPGTLVSGDGSGSSVGLPSIALVDSSGNPNWPLIAGGAVLLLGGLYFLGGSK